MTINKNEELFFKKCYGTLKLSLVNNLLGRVIDNLHFSKIYFFMNNLTTN